MKFTRLSIIIPAYNEGRTIHRILDKVRAVKLMQEIEKEVIIVNDCSTDDTEQAARRYMAEHPDLNIRYLAHEVNKGKGAALHTGIAAASGEYLVIQDADLEYDPAEYPRLLKPIIENKADVVFGSRFLGDQAHRVLYFWHYLGNRFLTTLSNCFTNLNLTDMETCYKVFRRNVIDDLTPRLVQNRFGFEPEITAKVARRRYRVYETSVSYSGRTYAEGKKIGWRDGFKALWCIVRYGLKD